MDQWNKNCAVKESNVTYSTLLEFINSLQWTEHVNIVSDCQDLFARFGYEVSTRTSSQSQLILKCRHAGERKSRVTDEESKYDGTSSKMNCGFGLNFYKTKNGNMANEEGQGRAQLAEQMVPISLHILVLLHENPRKFWISRFTGR